MSSVKLRYPEQRDAEWMLKLEQNPDAKKYSDFDDDYTLVEIKNFIDINRTGADPSQARLVIEVDGKQAGTIDITGISKKNAHAEIGIYVTDPFRKNGVGTEALREAVQIAAMMGVSHMKALIAAGNQASMRLFEKVGFEKIGELPGWLLNGKENGIIYYLSIMGELDDDMFKAQKEAGGYDEFDPYAGGDPYELSKDPYDLTFEDYTGEDDDEFGGFESLDDYYDKL